MSDMIGFEIHNHRACQTGGVAAADAFCRANGLQFTPIRRRVLEILLAEHRAHGAYEILDILGNEGLSAQPPVAYRALDFLVSIGFCHKIERLNAFIACSHPGETHTPAFLICRICDAVAEAYADPARNMLAKAAGAAGFTVERAVIEAEGVCPNCREKEGS